MKLILFFATAIINGVPLVQSHCYFQALSSCTPDYYWRDYHHGFIPRDAVEGGRDSKGNPSYVARALFRYSFADVNSFNEPLVTSVSQGDVVVKGLGHGVVRETDKDIQILCGPYKENFEWRSVKGDIFPSLSHTHLIVGGREFGTELFIGRVYHEGNSVVGKVYNDTSPHKGIWVPQGQGQIHYSSYEILTFRCGVKICVS